MHASFSSLMDLPNTENALLSFFLAVFLAVDDIVFCVQGAIPMLLIFIVGDSMLL